jgi:predicted ABC-type ATPase
MPRPVIYVLAGVNGAGKSSIGGHLLTRAGLTWFNPDTFARELRQRVDCPQEEANAQAWQEGMRRFALAVKNGTNYAFETTLGGHTVAKLLRSAVSSHDVMIWFCGLSSPELHIMRVQARVRAGGHDIAEAKIRERVPNALLNLIALMPFIAALQVYDNSAEARPGKAIADPILLIEMAGGRLVWPRKGDRHAIQKTPAWAIPLMEAALAI